MCRRACWTWLSSSSSRVTLPWPSTRDSGSMATRRSWVLISVIFDQSMAKLRRLAGDEVGQELPERIGGRRAAGQEIVDLHHLVQRVDLVQRQRQFRVVRYGAVHQTGLGQVDLGEAGAQVEVVALGGQAAGHRAGAD